jgi:hypothetical protein
VAARASALGIVGLEPLQPQALLGPSHPPGTKCAGDRNVNAGIGPLQAQRLWPVTPAAHRISRLPGRAPFGTLPHRDERQPPRREGGWAADRNEGDKHPLFLPAPQGIAHAPVAMPTRAGGWHAVGGCVRNRGHRLGLECPCCAPLTWRVTRVDGAPADQMFTANSCFGPAAQPFANSRSCWGRRAAHAAAKYHILKSPRLHDGLERFPSKCRGSTSVFLDGQTLPMYRRNTSDRKPLYEVCSACT